VTVNPTQKISVVIPVYNEMATIEEILLRVQNVDLDKEIVIVDDGSRDGTRDFLQTLAESVNASPAQIKLPRSGNVLATGNIRVYLQDKNQGKGAALRRGFKESMGEIVIIQDADLEYDPREYGRVLAPLLEGKADAVFGSRFMAAGERRVLYFWHSVANQILTLMCNIVADLNLTDMETCYKAFRTSLLQSIPIRSDRFGLEPELTIKLAKRRVRVYETPITYHGRTYEEGKKIGLKDAFNAVYVILRFALTRDLYKDSGPEILDALSGAQRFNRWMAETIQPFVGQRVLETGAGIGNLSRILSPRRERYVAGDIEHEYLALLRARFQHHPKFEVRHCDLENPADFQALAGSVDSVVCLNVLEHIKDDMAGLRNIHSALAPGGRAIILVPQGQEIFGTLDTALGHYRRYSNAELWQKMEQVGFRVDRILEFNRVSRPAWYVTGRIMRRKTIGRFQLRIFDSLVWLWRRIDASLPWPSTSIIAIAVKSD
jgi:glycosyltransferase involved in cell wall biosynthesis/phospholipid N-methyltransferase